jgi:hypothetical protein
MSIGSIFVGIALLFASALVIGQPWWKPRSRTHAAAQALSAPTLESQRDAGYAALADLDFDYSVGKVNDDDYHAARARLMAQAVSILQQLDSTATDAEAQVEALVRSRRARQSKHKPAPSTSSAAQCPTCGATVAFGDQFCAKCGVTLNTGCPNCGCPTAADDHFCARCGTTLITGAQAV